MEKNKEKIKKHPVAREYFISHLAWNKNDILPLVHVKDFGVEMSTAEGKNDKEEEKPDPDLSSIFLKPIRKAGVTPLTHAKQLINRIHSHSVQVGL
jgi:hypothetical protein